MHRWHKIVIIVCAVIAALILAGLWYLRSRDFHDRIQAFIAAQVRQATGARVSFGQFQISWRPLAVDVRDVVVWGRESPAQPPLATIAHVHAKIRLTHWFPPAVEVPEARVDHPVLDVYYLRQGGTDLPQPPVPPPPGQPAAEPIFNFGIRQLTIQHGELQVQDRGISLDARLTGLRLGLDYQGGHYRGSFAFTRGVARIDGRPPLRQSAQVRFTLWPNDLRIDALDWRGPGVALTAHGMVQDLGAPRVEGHYQVRVELARFGRWANMPVIAGQAQAAGEIHWSAAAWQTRGRLRFTGIGLRSPWPALGGIGASGPYQAGDRGLRLPALQVSGGGGQGQIRLVVAQWRRFTLSGELHGFHLEKLMATAAALGVSRPLASLPPLAGTLAAKLQARGPIPPSRHLALTAQLRIVPPRRQPRPPRAAPPAAAPGRTAQGPAAAFPSAAPLPVAALLTAH
ncbi:MAG: AsmA family protein, partial [Terriglobales bacterium]